MSSIRPHLWKEIIDSVKGNHYPIEFVFVGDRQPEFPLPNHVQFHYATVKPAQCYQISFLRAKGELILWTADDGLYNHINPNNLDILYDFYKSFNRTDAVVGLRPIEDGHDIYRNHRFFGKKEWSPYMLPFAAINREYFFKLGGYDTEFLAGQSENDVIMRVYEAGGLVELCMNAYIIVDHVHKHDWEYTNTKGFRFYYPKDRERLEACWVKEGYGYFDKVKTGTISKTRLCPVKSYENRNDICYVSQGRKGHWE